MNAKEFYHTRDDEELILAYVPESAEMSFEDALALAHQRDIDAAGGLKASAETQLRLEAAARMANAELDKVFQIKENHILAELGFA